MLLLNGKVLVAGGGSGGIILSSCVYDPVAGAWTSTGSLATPRRIYTATLLPNGKVLVAGGDNGGGGTFLSSCELYDLNIGYQSSWQPVITSSPTSVSINSSINITGTLFKGISEASGGNASINSSTNYPLVKVRRLDNEMERFLPVTNFSDTTITASISSDLFKGHYYLTVFTNAIPSESKIFNIGTPTAITLSSFTAKAKGEKAVLKWQTETEIDNIGFNILRSESENGGYVKINNKLITAKGSATKGVSYKFKDKNVQPGKTYWYKLEDIDSGKGPTQHGPVKVEVAGSKKKQK